MAADDSRTSAGLMAQLRDLTDAAAWGRFWAGYAPRIAAWARARGLSADEVEEVTSRVLEKLVVAMPTFRYDPEHRFRAWLRAVVNNVVFDFWRARARRPGDRGAGGSEVLAALHAVEETQVGSLVEELNGQLEEHDAAQQRAVAAAQGRVEPRSWSAFWQTAVEGRKAAEVAGELGMTVAAVYVAKNRVGHLLREEFARAGVGQGAGE